MRRILYFSIIGLLCMACDYLGNAPSFDDDFVTYTISEGSHDVDRTTTGIFSGSSMRFQALFDSSCVYKNRIPENQHDINKLLGFSDCSSHHQVQSARFGWNWLNDSLRIYAYTYVNAERVAQELGTVELGSVNSFKIAIEKDTYIFTLNGKETVTPRGCSGGTGVAYKLLPYFGGDEVAPKKINIKIRYLE